MVTDLRFLKSTKNRKNMYFLLANKVEDDHSFCPGQMNLISIFFRSRCFRAYEQVGVMYRVTSG